MQTITNAEMQKKAVVNYPTEYFDFSSGVDLPNSEIQQYIQQGIEKCICKITKDGLKKTFSTISTGNSKVLVEAYLQDNKMLTIHVSVSKNYCQMSFCNVEY